MVLKKSKAGVAGGADMRNAEIHMNRRLQVFLLVHVFRMRMLHLSFRDETMDDRINSYGGEAFGQSVYVGGVFCNLTDCCEIYGYQRTAPEACAEFLGTVKVPSSQARDKLTEVCFLLIKLLHCIRSCDSDSRYLV